MKIFITGSNGMLGSEICEQLIKTDLAIFASGRGENRLSQGEVNNNYSYINLDITDEEAVKEEIRKIAPNYIIQCAAMTQVDDCETNKRECLRINVDGTKNILTIAEELNCRFIYISTDFVFDGNDGPYTESNEPKPINFYGESKLLAEELVMQSEVPWTIVRTVLLYGKTDKINRSNFIYWVRDNLQNGKQIKVVNDQIRTPTFIPDLATGIISIMEKLAVGIYHISGEEVMTPYYLALKVADLLMLNKELIVPVDSTTFSQPGKRPLKTGFIIEKAQKHLGFTPTPIDAALSQIFI